MHKDIVYQVDGVDIPYTIEGDVEVGLPEVMLAHDDNLIEGLDWAADGYTIVQFLDEPYHQILVDKVRGALEKIIMDVTGKKLDEPEQYHTLVDSQLHYKIMGMSYDGISFEELGFDIGIIEKRISQILGRQVSTLTPYGENHSNRLLLRIIRPGLPDNNPYHRDVWLDRLRHCINIYLPLWGSNDKSSLPLIPGSHLWKESQIERTKVGARINNIPFTVPAVTHTDYGLKSTRPNPSTGDVMIFSPYIIHGGGRNLSSDKTRISLEMRFWKAE